MIKCQNHPTCGIFLKRGLFKDIKTDITKCLIYKYKYKNTNTKYTNTTYDELPEIPNTLYIFEHLGFAQLYHTFKDCSVSQPKGFSGRLFLISHIPCFGLSTAILRRDFLMLKNSNLSGDTNMPDSTGKYFISRLPCSV